MISYSKLDYLKECKLTFQRDKEDEVYFYFGNGVIKVRPEGVELVPYNLNGTDAIWESQVINFNIRINNEIKFTDVEDFLWKVSNDEEERFEALLSAFGFLCSRHKSPTEGIAPSFMDEVLSPDGLTNGRTGKSLILYLISKVRSIVFMDGKNFNFGRYPFEQIGLDTDICVIDDVKPNFDFTDLFPALTGNLVIDKRYERKFEIQYSESPKFAITSNYAVIGSGGESEKARKMPIELAPYYDANFSPKDDFGYCFFTGWDESQMNDFYNFIFYAVRFYLKFGLIKSRAVNAEIKELIARTSPEFIEFMTECPLEPNVDYDLQSLLIDFEEKYHQLGHGGSRKFNGWLRVFVNALQLSTYGNISGSPRKPFHMSNGKLKLRLV